MEIMKCSYQHSIMNGVLKRSFFVEIIVDSNIMNYQLVGRT